MPIDDIISTEPDLNPTEVPTDIPDPPPPEDIVHLSDGVEYNIVVLSCFRKTDLSNKFINVNMFATTEGGYVGGIKEGDYENPIMVKKINDINELKYYIWDTYKEFDFVSMGKIFDKYKEILATHFQPTNYITLKF